MSDINFWGSNKFGKQMVRGQQISGSQNNFGQQFRGVNRNVGQQFQGVNFGTKDLRVKNVGTKNTVGQTFFFKGGHLPHFFNVNLLIRVKLGYTPYFNFLVHIE